MDNLFFLIKVHREPSDLIFLFLHLVSQCLHFHTSCIIFSVDWEQLESSSVEIVELEIVEVQFLVFYM